MLQFCSQSLLFTLSLAAQLQYDLIYVKDAGCTCDVYDAHSNKRGPVRGSSTNALTQTHSLIKIGTTNNGQYPF